MDAAPELERLWRESSAPLRAWFARRTLSASDADDLVQETFVRVGERLDTLLDALSVRAWVGTIARNVLADHARRRGVPGAPGASGAPGAPGAAGADGAAGLDERALAQPDDDPPLERTVAGWLEGFLGELDPADADALRFVDLEGRTQRELAEREGIGLSAAKSRVQRARARLRARLEACCTLAFDARGGILGWERRRSDCAGDGCR